MNSRVGRVATLLAIVPLAALQPNSRGTSTAAKPRPITTWAISAPCGNAVARYSRMSTGRNGYSRDEGTPNARLLYYKASTIECSSISVTGPVKFSEDESDVVSMAAKSNATFREYNLVNNRELILEPGPNGSILRSYTLNGIGHAYDSDAQQWLKAFLPNAFIDGGLNTSSRVAAWRKNGGIANALTRVAAITSTDARSDHYEALLLEPLNLRELDTLLLAAAIDLQTSSPDLRTFLTSAVATWPKVFATSRLLPSIAGAVARVPASRDRAAVLDVLANNADRDMLLLIAERAVTINSGHDQARLLMRLAERYHAMFDSELARVYYATVRAMPTDAEKREVLLFAVPSAVKSALASELLLQACDEFKAPADRAAVLLSFAEAGGVHDTRLNEKFVRAAMKVTFEPERFRLMRAAGR